MGMYMCACIMCEGVSFGRGEGIVSLHTHVYVHCTCTCTCLCMIMGGRYSVCVHVLPGCAAPVLLNNRASS